mmetsp:Transcript_10154/g.29591  ORF Transcript_10154/g.29591 Transcript_10154/m.29591 type:complete len:211 (-) Transcript_10154:1343-1975(-)
MAVAVRAACNFPKSNSYGCNPTSMASCCWPTAENLSGESCNAMFAKALTNISLFVVKCSDNTAMTAMLWQPLSVSKSFTLARLVRNKSSMKSSKTSIDGDPSGPGAELRKLANASRRSTHCVMESAPRTLPPERAAEANNWSASCEHPKYKPSLVRARQTHVNSCGFSWSTRRRHLGMSADNAMTRCSGATLPIALCFSYAQSKLAMPWG